MELADCEQPLSAEAEVWLGALEEQKRLIEALPFVQGAVGLAISDASANANKVWAIVSCCWLSVESSSPSILKYAPNSARQKTSV